MKTSFSLAHLTVLGLAPPEMIAVASRTGYQTVGLRLIQVTETTPGYPLMDDKPMMRATMPRDNQGETAASIRMRTRRGWTDGARA